MALRLASLDRLSFAKWNAIIPFFSSKEADSTVANSTSLVSDSDMRLELPAGRIFLVHAHLGVRGSSTADVKVDWQSTGTLTCSARFCSGPAPATSDINATKLKIPMRGFSDDVSYGPTSGATAHVHETLVVETGSVGGSLQLRWAQLTSLLDPPSVVSAGSCIQAIPVD